jgi:hypothetical protein
MGYLIPKSFVILVSMMCAPEVNFILHYILLPLDGGGMRKG